MYARGSALAIALGIGGAIGLLVSVNLLVSHPTPAPQGCTPTHLCESEGGGGFFLISNMTSGRWHLYNFSLVGIGGPRVDSLKIWINTSPEGFPAPGLSAY